MSTSSRPTEKSSTAESESISATAHPTREEIELLAYQIYIERGCADGHDVEDWLQAEHEQSERAQSEHAQSERALFEKYANIGRIAKAAGG